MKGWREIEREREVNKLLLGLDSSVETQGRVGEGEKEEEEEEKERGGSGVGGGGGGGRGRGGVFWGFSSSPLQPVGLPGYRTVWSWW